jgi:hypothetical protein
MAERFWEEKSTEQYPSLEVAQRAALQALGGAIARAVRAGLDSGCFVIVDGVVRLPESAYNAPTVVNESRRPL